MKKFALIITALLLSVVLVASVSARVIKLSPSTVIVQDRLMSGDGDDFVIYTNDMMEQGFRYITVLVDSPGGSANDMFQIMHQMLQLKLKDAMFTTINLRMAASAGGYIWLCGDLRKAVYGSRFMFHGIGIWNQFGLVPWDDVPPEWKVRVAKMNYALFKLIYWCTGSEKIAVDFLGGGYGSENWYSAFEMKRLMIVDEII